MIMRAAARELSATRRAIVVAALMIMTAAATAQLRPAPTPPPPAPDLEALLPGSFGEWTQTPLSAAVLPEAAEPGPGEATAYRAYRDAAGRIVTLVVVYGPPLGDSVRLHRPESCYVAQGYAVVSRTKEKISLAAVDSTLVRLQTRTPSRAEAVTYWLRAGGDFTAHDAGAQWASLRRGMRAVDGALVRASSSGEGEAQFETHTEFLKAFAAALSPQARALLLTGEPFEVAA